MSHRPGPNLDGFTALVIDDHDDALYVLTTYLETCHARVIGAHSAQEAREVLAHTRPDIIVTDLNMPQESGAEFLRWLRTVAPEPLRQVPVIGISASGHYTPPDVRSSFTAWFGKPTDYDALCEAVAEIISRHRR
jgi:CheY-like chemotaxis protein